MSWYARTGPRRMQSGKFTSQLKPGTKQKSVHEYRGWSFSLIAHQTSGGIKRTRYAVSICDPQGNRAGYVRDCASVPQATMAAQQWVDDALAVILPGPSAGTVGTIPSVPTETLAQQK